MNQNRPASHGPVVAAFQSLFATVNDSIGPRRTIRPNLLWALEFVLAVGLVTTSIPLATPTLADQPRPKSAPELLARSLSILRTATADQPKTLRVLFYGQSITSPKWTDRAVEHLRATYPTVRYHVRKLAIGGFSASLLERTTERDLAEFYPDLIVFHVYGDHRAYERIIRTMREKTAADIIVETDHVARPPEPPCTEGLRWTVALPPGCVGSLWLKQRNWEDHMSGVVIPRLADRYGLVVEPRRMLWEEFLENEKVEPKTLLADDSHPNDAGWQLAARIFTQWFDKLVVSWNGEQSSTVQTMPPSASGEYEFIGNRIELVGSAPLNGLIAAKIDGNHSSGINGCWLTSRASSLPNVPDWPALLQVTLDPSIHQAEEWTATLHALDESRSRFSFAINGTSGPDGSGESDRDFVSHSGRVRIAATDWMLSDAVKLTGKRLQDGSQVHWQRSFICGDQTPVPISAKDLEVRYVIGTGLSNDRHKLSFSILPEGVGLVKQILIYRPPLY